MKKAFDQTVRDLKREVNKKVLKVPGIEQKILDATSNEPWGPHGSILSDIAQATRNYHEYQMIMAVIWKRINDSGKNWRHVYKALTVLEYLVGHGSERVIEEIREHAYQISSLSNFQYMDSSGRDQGSNVRKKSQSLVSLVSDKERIQEVRQKALANRDKFRSTVSTGRPGSYSSPGGYDDHYDDDRYGSRYSRDEDRYGNGREREWGSRYDDRYAKNGDSYGRDGERDSDERYNRDSYKDNNYRGGRGSDEYQYSSRNSTERDRAFDDDDRYSSRSSGARVDEPQIDESRLERRHSEPNFAAPPSYEEATREAQSQKGSVRNGDTDSAAALEASSASENSANPPENTTQGLGSPVADVNFASPKFETDGFDEFDPRGSVSVAPVVNSFAAAENRFEADLFGSASSDPIYSLALMPVTSTTDNSEPEVPAYSGLGNDFGTTSVSNMPSQPAENPFGDAPLKATTDSIPSEHGNFTSISSFPSSISTEVSATLPHIAPRTDTATGFHFGNSFGDHTYISVSTSDQSFVASPANFSSEILAKQQSSDIPSLPTLQGSSDISNLLISQGSNNISSILAPLSGPASFAPSQTVKLSTPVYAQGNSVQAGSILQPARPAAPTITQTTQVNLLSQQWPLAPISAEASILMSTPAPAKNPSKDKFETKSSVWADTLSRGLVNLNISGPKTNPHADIGVDFDSINRKEKRNEERKSSAAPVVSTITMGKAMGSGSGIGRVGASGMPPPPNPIVGNPGMGMGMGMGMGGYGGSMNQPMNMGRGMNMGMGMNQWMPMRPGGPGMTPGVGYNPMMGMGGYIQQQPYGRGYR